MHIGSHTANMRAAHAEYTVALLPPEQLAWQEIIPRRSGRDALYSLHVLSRPELCRHPDEEMDVVREPPNREDLCLALAGLLQDQSV